MKIYTEIVIDIKTGNVVSSESYEYTGPMAECKGSSGGGFSYSVNEVRFPDYVESAFKDLAYKTKTNVTQAINASPYWDYPPIDVDLGFFGTGYALGSFPSLYDMYGKFMAGLDVGALFKETFADTLDSPEVNNIIKVQSTAMDDEIEKTTLPRFKLGMRDMNAVMSSTYIVGKALIEDTKVKALTAFSADLKGRLITVANQRWSTLLNWNKAVIEDYTNILQLYLQIKVDVDNNNYTMKTKDVLWPFTVLDFERAAVGVLAGAAGSAGVKGGEGGGSGLSTGAKVMSGAATGAAIGAMVPGASPITALVGAGIGGIMGALA